MATEAVLDSSVLVALVTPEKYSEWASESVQTHEYSHILDLNFYEVANAINHKISDRFTSKDAADAFQHAEKMMNLNSIHSFSEIIADALSKALELKITVYDAAFLALADKLNIRLMSLDVKFAKKLETTKYYSLIEYPKT
jgi:predicted nucleic acid-binding protein